MCVIRDLSLCNHWQGELLSCVGQGIRPSGFLERSDCQLPLNTGGPVCIWALPFACHKVLMAGSLLHPKALKLAICKVGVDDHPSLVLLSRWFSKLQSYNSESCTRAPQKRKTVASLILVSLGAFEIPWISKITSEGGRLFLPLGTPLKYGQIHPFQYHKLDCKRKHMVSLHHAYLQIWQHFLCSVN